MALSSDCKHAEWTSAVQCKLLGKACPFQKYCFKIHRYEALDAGKCPNFVSKVGDAKGK